ncbi:STE/STE11/BCK1 protein [Salix suchowensis]|nr:STE/STE11/BCK1 protein [Salix suchowensis]
MGRSQRIVVCKCRTHCTVWDPDTQTRIGKGRHVTRGTKHNHTRDDRRMAALYKSSSGPVAPNRLSTSLKPLSRLQERRHWARLVEMELAMVYQHPVAPLIHPLVFRKDPKDGLENPGMDWQKPNEGDHALKEASHSNGSVSSIGHPTHIVFRATTSTPGTSGRLKDILEFNGTPAASALDNLPKDPKTVISALHLDPVVHAYVSCPTCYALYPYDRSDGGARSCTHHETETSPVCGTPLFKEVTTGLRSRFVPQIKYLHQDFKHWLGRLLSRKGVEDILDAYPTSLDNDGTHPITDIWLAAVFKELKDWTDFLF